MVTRAKSIPELSVLAVPALDDKLIVVDASSANTAKQCTLQSISSVTKADFLAANAAFADAAVLSVNRLVVRGQATPISSATEALQGTIFFDSEYLYVAVANNYVKRVPLQSF